MLVSERVDVVIGTALEVPVEVVGEQQRQRSEVGRLMDLALPRTYL